MYKTVANVIVFVLFAGASAAFAQISDLPQNQKLIDSYVLTMDNIRKFGEATDLFNKEYGDKTEDDEANAPEQPLEKQWQKIEKLDTKGILRKAGISARDYVLTVTTVMQTTIDVELKEKARTLTNAANIEFFKKNRAEITAIMKPE